MQSLTSPPEVIQRQIYLVRRQKVMFDSDLAILYGVSTSALNQAVKRNLARFPEDFMFQLNREETALWRSHLVMSNPGAKKGLRHRPYAFTEHGVAMLSSVLRSERAILVNIAIIRTFVKLRELLRTHKDLALKLEALERRYDKRFSLVFEVLERLTKTSENQSKEIGFRTDQR